MRSILYRLCAISWLSMVCKHPVRWALFQAKEHFVTYKLFNKVHTLKAGSEIPTCLLYFYFTKYPILSRTSSAKCSYSKKAYAASSCGEASLPPPAPQGKQYIRKHLYLPLCEPWGDSRVLDWIGLKVILISWSSGIWPIVTNKRWTNNFSPRSQILPFICCIASSIILSS